ncbi:uncharacterized protein LOC134184051 [Corticium candelabrum]|uniref:uncharacterized protein LOC134184051 n=1 Tax=Corticium candelabrum TaxID=121492 RepID=UPI002E2F4A73|nr:uncharacterized protein LOC134184051 [Corticium candelabrum]
MLQWDKGSYYQFYNKQARRKYGVVFLLLVSTYPTHSAADKDSNLRWEFAFHTPHMTAPMSHILRNTKLKCGKRYVFQVAAFNQFGTRGYTQASNPYSTEDLTSKMCIDWYSYGAIPPPQCSKLPSTVWTQVNLQLYNTQEDQSLYLWSNNCLDLKASRRIVWSRPQNILNGTKFCYELFLMPAAHSPRCKMKSRTYYLDRNMTDIVLANLQPGCYVFVTLYAGDIRKIPRNVNSEMELYFKIPSIPERCERKLRHYNYSKAVVYEKIGLAVSSQEYNHTTQMHHIFVMWSNPGAPVDEYLVLVMTIGRKQSRRINAVPFLNHSYLHQLEVKPSSCYRIKVQPVYRGQVVASVALPSRCAPEAPHPPSIPRVTSVTAATHSAVLKWFRPLHVHPDYPILYYSLVWGQSLAINNSRAIDPSSLYTHMKLTQPKSHNKYKVKNLLPSCQYYFQVCAISKAGNSSFTIPVQFQTQGFKHFHSGYLSVTKQEQTKDGFINVTIVLHINRSAANGDTAINHYYLTWGYGTQSLSLEGRSIARIGYTIQLDASENGSWSRMFWGLEPGTDYWYKAVAVTAFGLTSWSTEVTVRTLALLTPDAPENVSVDVDYSIGGSHFRAQVMWDNPASSNEIAQPLLASFLQWGTCTHNGIHNSTVLETVKLVPEATEYEITNLPISKTTEDFEFWLTVWSSNNNGNGTKSQPVVFFSPLRHQWATAGDVITTASKEYARNSDTYITSVNFRYSVCSWTIGIMVMYGLTRCYYTIE